MSNKNLKPKKTSLLPITNQYSNNSDACIRFFVDAKWPTGFYCEKCDCTHYYSIQRHHVLECTNCKHQHYLFAGTIFQNHRLEPFKLILGLYLFFSSNKGISAIDMRNALDINYKSACRLCKKCRILMAQSNSERRLDSMFYESDVTYIGSKTTDGKGMATEKQPFLILLSTQQENAFPLYIKTCPIPVDNQKYIETFMTKRMVLSKDRILNTDGKTTFQPLSNRIQLRSQKIRYEEKKHRLHWLNILWSNLKNQIQGVYHGVAKRSLPLFMQEQEWRFNRRNIGKQLMEKVQKYILHSSPMTEVVITYILDISESAFTKPVVKG